MFRGATLERIEKGRSSLENTGSRLESEFLGGVDEEKYKELAYKFLHPEKTTEAETAEEKYEKMLLIREAAQKEFEKALDYADRSKYIDFKNSVKLVEQCQNNDPENPSRFFSRALLNNIKDRFVDKYILKFFTATGTHLDVVHGVDCFFKLYDKATGTELAMATMDLTRNSAKDSARADVLLNIEAQKKDLYDPSSNNQDFDKKFFNNKIEEFGEMVTHALVDNYKRINK
jgi:hypothetical protein